MDHLSFQDQIPNNQCWGCGPQNVSGLQIKSYWDGDESVCIYVPQPHHMAGPPNVLNGGIIASLIDCHCVCTAIAAAYRSEGRELGRAPLIWYATGSLHVSYVRPTPITAPVELRARIVERSGRKTRLTCTLASGGEECARAEVTAVRVPAEWSERV
ncbi:MAG: PaaI family thioesterase [Gemmatimonadaceae bacterium]